MVHLFDIRTSKSAPRLRCFVNFDFETCFAPQRRSTFWTSQLPKATSKSAPNVRCFLAFSLANVLRATTACNFSSLISPDGSAPAALASLLFDPPEPQIIGKTQCFATFLPFPAPASSFFWLFLFFWSSLFFSSLLFSDSFHLCFSNLSILSEVWLLNFLRWSRWVSSPPAETCELEALGDASSSAPRAQSITFFSAPRAWNPLLPELHSFYKENCKVCGSSKSATKHLLLGLRWGMQKSQPSLPRWELEWFLHSLARLSIPWSPTSTANQFSLVWPIENSLVLVWLFELSLGAFRALDSSLTFGSAVTWAWVIGS